MRRIPTGTGGTLAVGFTAVSVHGYVKSFLRRIGEQLPHAGLVPRELVTAGQVEAIASGDIDLGFVRPLATLVGTRENGGMRCGSSGSGPAVASRGPGCSTTTSPH